jgi:hypothetical protein
MVKNKYLEISKDMIDIAFKEYHEFEKTGSRSYLMQSGEKAWNSLVQLSFYYSKPEHQTHKDTINSIKNIKGETQKDMIRLAGIGEAMHANFYNDFMSPELLLGQLEDIRNFVNKKLREEGYILRK